MLVSNACNENLLDVRLHLTGCCTQHLRVGRHSTQVHQLQSLALNLLYHHRQNILLRLLVFRQKYQTRTVLSFLRHRDALQQNKLVRNLNHDTGTVARLVARLSAAVFHVLQHLQCIVYQFVTLSAVDVHYHSHAASIMLVIALVESFSFHSFHIILPVNLLKFAIGRKIISYCHKNHCFAD